jgi:hypothetical protein
LELLQSVSWMLTVTRATSAPETLCAIERAVALAEKTGNLKRAAALIAARGVSVLGAGDFGAASALADQALELALREGSPVNLARAHMLQIWMGYYGGDPARVEKNFAAGLKFFNPPDLKGIPTPVAISAVGLASENAWRLGRADVARQREAQMMAPVNANSPYEVVDAAGYGAFLRNLMGECERAEAYAAPALALSQQLRFAFFTSKLQVALGDVRAQLGRPTEGIALIRQESPAHSNSEGTPRSAVILRFWRPRRSVPVRFTRRLTPSRRLSGFIRANSDGDPSRVGCAEKSG